MPTATVPRASSSFAIACGRTRSRLRSRTTAIGFDPHDPAARESDAGGEGMGLMIIRSLTDSIEIESDASGSRISFSKRVGRAG